MVPVIVPNTRPVADDLVVQGVTGSTILGRVTATDAQAGQTLHFSVVSGPSNGRLVMLPGGEFDYRSNGLFTGVDTATFQACDNGVPSLCDQGTITFNIFPIASDDIAQTFENHAVVIPLVPDNASPGAALVSPLVTPPANGTATLAIAAGTATYTPNSGFLGTDLFVFRICSPTAATLCDTATITITVIKLNQPPVIDDLTMQTTARVPVQGQLSISDPDGDAVTATRVFRRGRGLRPSTRPD